MWAIKDPTNGDYAKPYLHTSGEVWPLWIKDCGDAAFLRQEDAEAVAKCFHLPNLVLVELEVVKFIHCDVPYECREIPNHWRHLW